MTVDCLVYRVCVNGRKWEHFTAVTFRSILGGRVGQYRPVVPLSFSFSMTLQKETKHGSLKISRVTMIEGKPGRAGSAVFHHILKAIVQCTFLGAVPSPLLI